MPDISAIHKNFRGQCPCVRAFSHVCLKSWHNVKQLAIEFQNQGLQAIEFIPAEMEKEQLADPGQVQQREYHESMKPLLMLEYEPCGGTTNQNHSHPTSPQNEIWQQNCTKWSSQPTDMFIPK